MTSPQNFSDSPCAQEIRMAEMAETAELREENAELRGENAELRAQVAALQTQLSTLDLKPEPEVEPEVEPKTELDDMRSAKWTEAALAMLKADVANELSFPKCAENLNAAGFKPFPKNVSRKYTSNLCKCEAIRQGWYTMGSRGVGGNPPKPFKEEWRKFLEEHIIHPDGTPKSKRERNVAAAYRAACEKFGTDFSEACVKWRFLRVANKMLLKAGAAPQEMEAERDLDAEAQKRPRSTITITTQILSPNKHHHKQYKPLLKRQPKKKSNQRLSTRPQRKYCFPNINV